MEAGGGLVQQIKGLAGTLAGELVCKFHPLAFANTDGGRLLIGVKDNGKVVGIKNEEDIHMIEAAAQVFCKPEVDYRSRIWEYGSRRVLEISIAPSPRAPHTAPDEGGRLKEGHIEHTPRISSVVYDEIALAVKAGTHTYLVEPNRDGRMEVTIPANMTAEIYLPGRNEPVATVGSGRHTFKY
ncbi:MAG: ATP-binding protein [Bacteroidales bacterium]|nr:ATP-binding protein [Bacteroidales bacterium]